MSEPDHLLVSADNVQDRSYPQLFPEMAVSLLYFIQELHAALKKQGVERVFFLSREGQPLKAMFDMYCECTGERIKSAYLEVSRRSTLLPSLVNLKNEEFDTLFRQYKNISLFEFLSSLGLEKYCAEIAVGLHLVPGDEKERIVEFQESTLFSRLKSLPFFEEIFESERLARRDAFIQYLSDLSGGSLPEKLVLVDVGWKGTIQDNLFSLLCKEGHLAVKQVEGYYVGLNAKGMEHVNNIKHGLLFSSVGSRSKYFHVFNENRALFEVVLAADHGSITSYEMDANGKACAIRGVFEEEDMIKKQVFPLLRSVMGTMQSALTKQPLAKLKLKEVAQAHARMVFNPTQQEMHWFSSIFHVENYGVFEKSQFTNRTNHFGLRGRLHFGLSLLRRGNRWKLGFWPWRTLHDNCGKFAAQLYARLRRLQD